MGSRSCRSSATPSDLAEGPGQDEEEHVGGGDGGEGQDEPAAADAVGQQASADGEREDEEDGAEAAEEDGVIGRRAAAVVGGHAARRAELVPLHRAGGGPGLVERRDDPARGDVRGGQAGQGAGDEHEQDEDHLQDAGVYGVRAAQAADVDLPGPRCAHHCVSSSSVI